MTTTPSTKSDLKPSAAFSAAGVNRSLEGCSLTDDGELVKKDSDPKGVEANVASRDSNGDPSQLKTDDSNDNDCYDNEEDECILNVLDNINDKLTITRTVLTRSRNIHNENVGAFPINGPNHRTGQNHENSQSGYEHTENSTSQVGTGIGIGTVSNRNINEDGIIHEASTTTTPMVNAILVEETTIVTAVATPTTNIDVVPSPKSRRPHFITTSLLLCIVCVGVVGVSIYISSKRQDEEETKEPVTSAPVSSKPKDEEESTEPFTSAPVGRTCFGYADELRNAVVDYLAGDNVVRSKYGDLGTWCVGQVKDLSYLFCSSEYDCQKFYNPYGATFNEDITEWNTSSATTMEWMFYNATLFNQDLSGWDVSSVTTMQSMFNGATSFIGRNMTTWDVSAVRDMYSTFENAKSFNGDVTQWNTSSATTMERMFFNATLFNQDLSGWDVSSVTTMQSMFNGATSFIGRNMSTWDVSEVRDMYSMFENAKSFNGDVSYWDVSFVQNMNRMFAGAVLFNVTLSSWDVSAVTEMSGMFWGASSFSSNLSLWYTSSVTSMNGMFDNATYFNGDVSTWDVSNVQSMNYMFANSAKFNGNISKWDVSNVQTMDYMFANATKFNGNLSMWNVSSVVCISNMFDGAVSFKGDLSSWDIPSNSCNTIGSILYGTAP